MGSCLYCIFFSVVNFKVPKTYVWTSSNQQTINSSSCFSEISPSSYRQNRTCVDIDISAVVHSKYCVFHEEVAINVSYRNRTLHLAAFQNSLHRFLIRQQIQYRVFIIELDLPTIFNRGYLLNVGFIIAKRIGTYRCFVFHDVDLIPTNDSNLYNCTASPTHMSSGNTKFNTNIPYRIYIGGVMMITSEHFSRCNGFSNKYFGWGGEDDDFKRRLDFKKINVTRLDTRTGHYKALLHGRDALNLPYPMRGKLLKTSALKMQQDGLSTTSFEIVTSKLSFNSVWVLIKYKADLEVPHNLQDQCKY